MAITKAALLRSRAIRLKLQFKSDKSDHICQDGAYIGNRREKILRVKTER